MKISKIVLSLVLLTLGAAACKKSSGTVHKSGSGAQAKIGDVVSFNFTLKKDTALLMSNAINGQPAQEVIADAKKIKDPIYRFIMESLSSMKKGDSVSFTMKLDTFKTKPRGMEDAKEITLMLGMTDIKSEAEFLATLSPQEQEMFKMQRKQMAVQERAQEKEAELKAVQTLFDSSRTQFTARAQAVADSMNTLSKDMAAGKLANIQTTATGLKYVVLKEGSGAAIGAEKFAFVNYYGALPTGKKFDESFGRGAPLVFPVGVGQVIPGWDEGVALMKEGSTVLFLVPAKLGYGDRPAGEIPANSDLVFYVELLKAI